MCCEAPLTWHIMMLAREQDNLKEQKSDLDFAPFKNGGSKEDETWSTFKMLTAKLYKSCFTEFLT